jgi:hypothetical protein
MKFFLETTKWADGYPNHVYLLDDSKSKMTAYVRNGTNEVFKFKKPIRIDTRGRSFKEVPNTFGYNTKSEDDTSVPKWTITGSKGDLYVVQKIDNQYNCSCSGFRFRGNCKHVEQIAKEQS